MSQEGQAPPREFICPISLELMRDPVTVCTGVTYERRCIQSWFDRGEDVCPSTMQPLSGNHSMFPNLALRSLITTWCASHSIPAISNNDSSIWIDKPGIEHLLLRIARDPQNTDLLRKLKNKARESARNSACLVEAGAIRVLGSVLTAAVPVDHPDRSWLPQVEECISILVLLPPSAGRRVLISPRPLRAMTWIVREGSPQGKRNTMALLDGLAVDKGAQIAIGSTAGLMEGLVDILRRNSNQMLVNACLRTLLSLGLPIRNRVKATESGAVGALVELLPEAEGGVAEHILTVIELLCGCAQGRQALKDHALAVPAVIKKVCRVSDTATDRAIGILWLVCDESWEREKMYSGLGLYGKLLNLVRVENLDMDTRRKMIDILDKVYNAKLDYTR